MVFLISSGTVRKSRQKTEGIQQKRFYQIVPMATKASIARASSGQVASFVSTCGLLGSLITDPIVPVAVIGPFKEGIES